MRWQSVARAVVAVIGIGCAVTVYVLLRPRPAVEEPSTTALLDDTATSATKGTKIKRVDAAGREAFSMVAGETLGLADGRRLLKKGVTFKFVKGEVLYTVTATQAELSGEFGPTGDEPEKIVFQQKVKMVGDDGFSVEAEDATYLANEERVVFPGAVAFNRERMAGRGVGGDLYMDRSVFWLNDQSHMTIKPEAGGVPVEVSATKIGLAQADGYLRAMGSGRLTRESQELSGDEMVVHFAEGTQSVRRIELVGNSNVRRTGRGQRPDMRGDDIDLDFIAGNGLLTHARMSGAAVLTLRDDAGVTRVSGNAIDFSVGADGETLTRLDATGATEVVLPRVNESPARTIHSNGMVAQGADPKGLERAVFSGGVQYREMLPAARGQAAAVRLATSQSLVLNLDGAMNQVKVADFRQNFCFVGPLVPTAAPLDPLCSAAKALPARGTMDDTMAAAADEGTYDAKAETLQLRSTAPTRPRPRVVNREVDVDAREIDIDIKANAIDARGSAKEQVDSNRKPTPAQSKPASAPGLFESDKAIVVKANKLNYSKPTGAASYSGAVFMFQQPPSGQSEGPVLKADEVSVDDQKHDIKAKGNVRSTFYIDQAPDEPGRKGPTRTQINSDAMTYTEADRKAVYTGKAWMESGEGVNKQSLEAGQITLEMHADRRALKWLEGVTTAPGILIARLPEGRQAQGLKLTYDADKDVYVVTGRPAQFVSRSEKDPATCEVATGTTLDFPRTGELGSVRNEGVLVGSASGNRTCSEVIK